MNQDGRERFMDAVNEAELLARAQAGDTAAFEESVKPHLAMLFAYSRAICGDHHAAQDVVQETVLIAYRKLSLFFVEADFSTWLRAIARREALNARKKLAKMPLLAEDAIERYYAEPQSEAESPERQALRACLQLLAGRMSSVIRGYYFEGRPLAELAASMNQTVSAVKQLLYRARLALRDCVRRRLAQESGT
jgi:RNA polymerase sigma-70 factor (ECF subfamily)